MKMEPGFVTSLRQELSRFPDLCNELDSRGGLTTRGLVSLVAQPESQPSIDIEDVGPNDVLKPAMSHVELGGSLFKSGKVAHIILAGGMGTRMGGPKALVRFSNDMSMLAFKLTMSDQLPHILMINPSLKNEIIDHVASLTLSNPEIGAFEQFESFQLTADNRLALDEQGLPRLYPTGTGDLPIAMNRAELGEALIRTGIEYIVVNNVDNMSLPVDLGALGVHAESGFPMTFQVVLRERGDVGAAVVWKDGNKQIVELSQLPDDIDVSTLTYTNTNNCIISVADLAGMSLGGPPYRRVRKTSNNKMYVQYERFLSEWTNHVYTNFCVTSRELNYFPIKTRDDLQRAEKFFFT